MKREILKLTFGAVMPHLCVTDRVKVLYYDGEVEEELFVGSMKNVPWIYTTWLLDTSFDGEAIAIDSYIDDDGVNRPMFVIWIREDD